MVHFERCFQCFSIEMNIGFWQLDSTGSLSPSISRRSLNSLDKSVQLLLPSLSTMTVTATPWS